MSAQDIIIDTTLTKSPNEEYTADAKVILNKRLLDSLKADTTHNYFYKILNEGKLFIKLLILMQEQNLLVNIYILFFDYKI